MKMRKKLPWCLLAACCVVFVLYVVLTRGIGDHTPPEITVPKSTLQISVYAQEQELLSGVTALDQQDGDVTDRLVVESVSDIYDGTKATVTYAAFDQSGNVSKATRPVEYTDYTGPRFTLSAPLIFREGSNLNVFGPLDAVDSLDGSLKDRIKGILVSSQPLVSQPGLYEVAFRVTNSLGDTRRLQVPVEVIPAQSGASRMNLITYLVYLEQGSDFDPAAYLTGDSWSYLGHIESDVDTSVPGTYSVTYTDQNSESYGKTRLIAVVEE